MTDRPILFSAPMILALLAGTKTQTRRAIPLATQIAYDEYGDWCCNVSAGVPTSRQWEEEFFLERTRIKAGDTLWVRESVQAVVDAEEFDAIRYLADGHVERSRAETAAEADRYAEQLYGYRRRKGAPDRMTGVPVPSIHMPRWASRLTLTVTDVRVQRLQDISEEDAIAEGYPPPEQRAQSGVAEIRDAYPIAWYSWLWDSINGVGAWAANPWVTATTFAVERRNIDAEG